MEGAMSVVDTAPFLFTLNACIFKRHLLLQKG